MGNDAYVADVLHLGLTMGVGQAVQPSSAERGLPASSPRRHTPRCGRRPAKQSQDNHVARDQRLSSSRASCRRTTRFRALRSPIAIVGTDSQMIRQPIIAGYTRTNAASRGTTAERAPLMAERKLAVLLSGLGRRWATELVAAGGAPGGWSTDVRRSPVEAIAAKAPKPPTQPIRQSPTQLPPSTFHLPTTSRDTQPPVIIQPHA